MSEQESRLTKSSIIRGVKSEDDILREDAWVRMTAMFGPLVHRQIRRLGVPTSDISDIVQTVFFKAATSIDSYHHNRDRHGSFRAWLWGITRNTTCDYFTKKSKSPAAYGGDGQKIIEETAAIDWEPDPKRVNSSTTFAHHAIALIKKDFSESTWLCFWRTVVHGESAVDIGEDLGLKPAAVRQAKFRVIRRLQEELDAPSK